MHVGPANILCLVSKRPLTRNINNFYTKCKETELEVVIAMKSAVAGRPFARSAVNCSKIQNVTGRMDKTSQQVIIRVIMQAARLTTVKDRQDMHDSVRSGVGCWRLRLLVERYADSDTALA